MDREKRYRKYRGIWQKILADSQILNKQSEKRRKNGVPDTAYVCPLLCAGVVCANHVSVKTESLIRGASIFIFTACPTPQNHCQPRLFYLPKREYTDGIFMCSVRRQMTGQVSQSGKPLCTGASLWAVPKLARERCPLEPWHVN